MAKPKKMTLTVQETVATIFSAGEADFISLTYIARYKNPERSDDLVRNWLRNRNTVEFLGLWEGLHNPAFNSDELERIKMQAGLNSFSLTPKQWIETTGAIGITSRAGRDGGTYAHRDIAFEFAIWMSVEFKLYLIQESQRLKNDEERRLSGEWNLNRTLSKLNPRIHTDAIKTHLIPSVVSPALAGMTYASEADVFNVALFGQTAKMWRDANPDLQGNRRDHATVEQLLVLANMEGINAELIRMGLSPSQRVGRLNEIAILQMKLLVGNSALRQLNS